MILTFYIARRFVGMFVRVFAIFFGIMMLIETIDQLRKYSGTTLGLGDAVYMASLSVPESLYRILPLIVILASITLFLGLARSSELVVVRAAGRSGLRFLAAPVVAALVIGMLAVAVFNPLVAATSKQYDTLSALYEANGGSVMSVSGDGLWMRQGDAAGQSVIKAARANPDGGTLQGVTFLTFLPDGTPAQRIEAKTAELRPGQWVLTGVKRWNLASGNPERDATALPDGLTLATDLTTERIRNSFGAATDVAFWNLPRYIKDLERAGFSARSHRVWLQMELALPLLLASMVLVAAGFTMRHARFGQTGSMVLLALTGGFMIFFLRNFAQVLGENSQIPILIAAWIPPVAAIMLALGLLLHLEDG